MMAVLAAANIAVAAILACGGFLVVEGTEGHSNSTPKRNNSTQVNRYIKNGYKMHL